MGALFTRPRQIKYALPNDIHGMRIALAGGAFDTIIPSASTFSASSSGTKHPPFDVFINHCGQDVKQTLASRIYKSLDATGLKVFLDKPELKYGDLLPKALEEAMATATIGIAIFSEHYAESPWCLAELEYMVKTGKTIIPVFYHVQPSDLKWVDGGKGAYVEAFSHHERKGRYAPEALQRWKEALQKASLCIGPIIKSIDDEEKVVRDVVNRVKELKNTVPLDVAKHPVALDEVVQDFDDTISLQSAGCHVKIIGIWGMGGSGKTTLAKEIFNRRHSKMQWSSFLSDVRDAARKDLLLEKQKTLLKDLDLKDERHENLDRGKQILKNRLSRSASVLIILDDVDSIDQLDALLPSKESFENKIGDQSLIIVTTQDKDVLRRWGISAIYRMKRLEAIHAKELFCWHAFKQIIPQQGFEDLVDKFLQDACAGLPLSLKVLGGQLCGEPDREYWLQTFIMYSQIPHDDIANRLKVSYDALKKQEQQMFLDVACFFIGERSSAAIAAWNAEFHGLIGWKTLVNKCLVEEDEDGLIEMHDHLRDLGRVISKESAYRLWSPQQIIEILPKVQEPIRVRGVGSAVGDNCYEWQGKIIIKTNQEECSFAPWLGLKIFFGNGKFLSQEQSQLSKDLIWLQCTYFEHKNLPPCGLKNLRILDLSDSDSLKHLWAADADALLQLRELVIQRCKCFAGFPNSIGRLEKLQKVIIKDEYDEIGCDALIELPQEFCYLKSLEHLELRHCSNLSSLPSNFGRLTKLRHLNLSRCTKLEALPSNFGELTELRHLDLSGCTKLEALPSNFGELTELRHLDLSGCTKLEALPDSFKKLTQLEYLSLEDCREVTIKSESNVFENMTKLRYLDLEGCAKLTELRLPQEFCYLKSLEHLDLRHCSNLSSLPSNFGKLTKLRNLDLSHCTKLEALPSSFGELTELRHLNLTCCTKLEALPDSFKKLTLLEYLSLEDCREVAIKSESNVFENMTKLRYLNLEGCEKLKDLRLPELVSLRDLRLKGTGVKELLANIFHLTNLTNLVIGSEFLITLPTSVGSLSALTTLTINGCKELKSLPDSLEHLSFLRDLTIEDTGVKCLPKSLTHLQRLTIRSTPISELSFRSWGMLKSVDLRGTKVSNISIGGDSCPALETLDLSWNNDLRELETLPEKLKTLNIRHCDELEKIESLGNMRLLKELKITNCPKLMVIACHSETSIALKKIHLEECQKLETIEGLKNIKSLEKLKLHDCPELNGLAGLAELTSLRKIDLQNCHNLTNIEDLENTRSLEKFIISDCQKLEALPSLPEITSQQELQLERCHKLKTIKGLESIKSLRKLRIYDCQELDGFPGLGELSSLKEFVLIMCPKLKKMEGLGNIRSLETLIISDCLELESLPNLSEITALEEFKLTELRHLDLSGCTKLEALPSNFGELTELRHLDLSGCTKLEALPSNFGKLTELRDLYLLGCTKLEALPSNFGELTELRHLDLSGCTKLEALPDSFKKLTQLEYLSLEDCREVTIKSESNVFENMTKLRYLDLEGCAKLTELRLPQEFCYLKSLEHLDLRHCSNLSSLPSNFGKLTKLRNLDLSHCTKLEALPSNFGELTELRHLNLTCCTKLEALPDSFKKLTLLEYLSLEDCREVAIKSESNVFENMTKLRYLNLEGCEKLRLAPPRIGFLKRSPSKRDRREGAAS